jgi:hypothetical protein
VLSRDAAGNLATSGDFTFTTTTAPDTLPPVLNNIASSSVTSSGVTITWATNEDSDTQVDHGTTTTYGSTSPLNMTLTKSHSQSLSGLTANTTYHFRAKSKDATGNLGVSGDFTFKTAAASNETPPAISAVQVSSLSSRNATITWITNVPADSQVFFGTTTACAKSTKLNTTRVTVHSRNLSGLLSNTIYYYRVQSRDAAGTLAVSPIYGFQTKPSKHSKLVYPRLVASRAHKTGLSTSEFTGIAVVNLGAEEALLTFTAFDISGYEISGPNITNPVERTLPPNGQIPIIDTELFGSGLADQNSIGWMRVDSSSDAVTGFTLIFDAGLSMLDGAPVSDEPMTQFVFTEIDDRGFTDIHVANANNAPANIRFDLMQSNGMVRTTVRRTVNPLGAVAESIYSLFPGVAPESNDYLRIISDLAVVPFQLMGKMSQYIEALNGIDLYGGATTLYSPQFVMGGAYRSTLSIANLEDREGTLTLRMVGDNGAQIGATQMLRITGSGKVYISDPSFFGLQSGEMVQGYIEILSNGPRLAGNVIFGDPEMTTFATALPLVSQLESSLVFGQVASDQTYFTGLALLNPNYEDAVATVDIYKADGTLDDSITITIPARQRVSKLLTQFFPALLGQNRSSGHIRVTVDQGIAGFSVFGTHDLNCLSAVPAQILR